MKQSGHEAEMECQCRECKIRRAQVKRIKKLKNELPKPEWDWEYLERMDRKSRSHVYRRDV